MFFSPFALPKPRPLRRDMPARARREAKQENQRFVQTYLRGYIDRAAKVSAFCMAFYLISVTLLGYPLLVVMAGAVMLSSFIHLAVLIFWKQHLDDRFGPIEPPE